MTTVRNLAAMTLLLAAGLIGCVVNPVTGERELALVSAEDEVAIGRAQYSPSRQMQGGDYVVDPELARYVSDVGQRLAAVSDRDLPYEFAVLNNSVPNAWALPGGKIAINRGLLVELDSEAELAAVLGHEIVHAAARHGAQAMQRGILLQGALLATAVATQGGNYSGLAVGAAGLGAQLINQRHGREAELESDFFGMQYMARAGYDPQAAVSLQQTFVRLSEGQASQSWLAGLFASHPPSAERVATNRETAAQLNRTGETGRERYQSAIAGVITSKPAYEAYDNGRRALTENRHQEAERFANEALRLLPAEAQFHALLGDIEAAQGRDQAAITHYANALSRNDAFFYYSLQKGLAHQRLSQWDSAASELEASVALLPTADAHLGLGQLAERRGDLAQALSHYRQAAASGSQAGQLAQDAVVRLDLPANPQAYLALRTGLDAAGRLALEVSNPTRLAVTDISILVRYVDAQGAVQAQRFRPEGSLAANASSRFSTGLGPFPSEQSYEVTIESARAVTN